MKISIGGLAPMTEAEQDELRQGIVSQMERERPELAVKSEEIDFVDLTQEDAPGATKLEAQITDRDWPSSHWLGIALTTERIIKEVTGIEEVTCLINGSNEMERFLGLVTPPGARRR